MSLHDNFSETLPKNYTKLNIHTSMGSGTNFFSVRNEDAHPSFQSEKIFSEPQVSFSVFDEGSCGEPQTAQHLVIDFTHNEKDNEFVQKKCCAFWKFIESHPEINHLMVVPDSHMYPSTPTPSESTSEEATEKVTTVTVDEAPVFKEHTAVSMLDFVSREGLIDKSFEAKIPQSFCPLGSREYLENRTTRRILKTRNGKLPDKKAVCRCGGRCNTCSKTPAEKEKVPQSPEEVKDMCDNLKKWDLHHPKCRPVCKSRRREWKGEIQHTSAELLLDRKPQPLCFRRCPTKVFPNSPCPLFGRTKNVIINKRDAIPPPANVVRVCQAPLDDHVDTPYLRYVDMAKKNGAWDMVTGCCAFCRCGPCCVCSKGTYIPDETKEAVRKGDMRQFDARVKNTYQEMRIMYDKP